jgi:hypothetical protein
MKFIDFHTEVLQLKEKIENSEYHFREFILEDIEDVGIQTPIGEDDYYLFWMRFAKEIKEKIEMLIVTNTKSDDEFQLLRRMQHFLLKLKEKVDSEILKNAYYNIDKYAEELNIDGEIVKADPLEDIGTAGTLLQSNILLLSPKIDLLKFKGLYAQLLEKKQIALISFEDFKSIFSAKDYYDLYTRKLIWRGQQNHLFIMLDTLVNEGFIALSTTDDSKDQIIDFIIERFLKESQEPFNRDSLEQLKYGGKAEKNSVMKTLLKKALIIN